MIPKLHYITQGLTPEEHIGNIQRACSSGAELVQLSLKDVTEKQLLQIAVKAREITSHFQTRLIINGHFEIAKEVKADGVHLGKTDTCPAIAREQLYSWQIIGGTAHTLEDCSMLIYKDVDYISLGPLKATNTKMDTTKVLGLKGYTLILEALKTETPILGVGGVTTDDVPSLLETGVSGIAVSEEITKDFNTIKIFNQLLSASSTAEQRYTFE